MSLRTVAFGCAPIFALASLPGDALAQGRPRFKSKSIRRQQVDAPDYAASGTGAYLGAQPSTLWRQWYKIEVQFQSAADWADDVKLKYYVLMGTGREARLFAGEITHVNGAKGTQHYSAMFLHPYTLRRYGAGQVEAVAVQLYHQNRLEDQDSEPQTRERWWEKFTPMSGYLLAPQDTPWAVIGTDRFEAVKPTRQ